MTDFDDTRVDHPRHVLYQVAKSMNGRHNDLSVTLPANSTWKTALQAVQEAMGNVDEKIYLMPPNAGSTSRPDLRETALELARNDNIPIVGP